jgi:DNA adenine methylase
LQVLFARDPLDPRFFWTDGDGRLWKGVNEVVGDLNGDLDNFYEVLQDPATFPELFRRANLAQFDEATWRRSKAILANGEADRVVRAWALFVCCRLSREGAMQGFTPMTKVRLRGGQGNEVNAFLKAVEGLREVHKRLRRVQVLCRDAVALIRQYDVPGTLIYCDPPYFHPTTTATNVYRHEMTEAQHRQLLDALLTLRHARVILSGYASPLYDAVLAGWSGRHTREVANHAAGGKKKRRMTEVIWCNF